MPRRETVLVIEIAGRAGLWACRSLAAEGFRVVGTAINPGGIAAGKHCDAVYRLPRPEVDADAFTGEVLSLVEAESADVILPTDHEAAAQVLASAPVPAGSCLVGATADQYRRLGDKAGLARTAADLGLDVPRTVAVSRGELRNGLPSLPSIIKPATVGSRAAAPVEKKAVLVRSEADRDARIGEILRANATAVVQEYVDGPQWRVHFVATRSAFASVTIVTVRSWPREVGMSTVSRTSASAPAGLTELAERLIRHVGYLGPGSVQFLVRSGRLYVHDVNLRLPSAVGASIAAGLEMPLFSVEAALGRLERVERFQPRYGGTYVWLGGELRALARDLRKPVRELTGLLQFATDVVPAFVRPGDVVDLPRRHSAVRGEPGRLAAPGRQQESVFTPVDRAGANDLAPLVDSASRFEQPAARRVD